MNSLGALIIRAIDGAPLTKEAAVLAAAVCVLGQCRIHGIDEDVVWKEAKKAAPTVILPRA